MKFCRRRFDLILADVRLPDGRGTKLVADALSFRRDVGCILMSGYTQTDDDPELFALSNVSFLHKPFSLDDLLNQVRQQLAKIEPLR